MQSAKTNKPDSLSTLGLYGSDEMCDRIQRRRWPVRWTSRGLNCLLVSALWSVGDLEAQFATGSLTLVTAETRGNPNGVYLTFSKPLDPATALDTNHYQITPDIAVLGARFGRDQSEVILTTEMQIEDLSSYSVIISDVQDQAAGFIDPNPAMVPLSLGAEYRRFRLIYRRFDGIGGTLLSDLVPAAVFPDQPSVERLDLESFEMPQNVGDNYGAQLFGFYEAPVTGDYRFWLASDDQGALYLSTDEDPAHQVQIASEPEWADFRAFQQGRNADNAGRGTPPSNVSSFIPLTAGQVVYLEGVMKEGGGGDHLSVAVQLPGGPEPANGAAPISVDQFRQKFQYSDGTIFGRLGPVQFTTQPTDAAAQEGKSITLTARVEGTPPYAAQWLKDGVPIVGATNLSFTTPPLTAEDDGARYRVVVSNHFSSVTSETAMVEVLPNPYVVSLVVSEQLNEVRVLFTKPMALVPGAGFTISEGITVHEQGYGSSQREVVLITDRLEPFASYLLTIGDLADLEGHVVLPNPIELKFTGLSGRLLTDFNSELPVGSVTSGSAFVGGSGGVSDSRGMRLTTAAAGQRGTYLLDAPTSGLPVEQFTVSFKVLIGGGTLNSADGLSFNLADDLKPVPFDHRGAGTGLTIVFTDRFDESQLGPGIDVLWQRKLVGRESVIISQGPAGRDYVDVYIHVDPDGTLDLHYGGRPIFADLPTPYTPIAGARFGFAASTRSTGWDNHWIDDLYISTLHSMGPPSLVLQPASSTTPEGLRASFRVLADGTPPYSYQWYKNGVQIPGATSWSYLTPPNPFEEDGSAYSVVVSNALGFVISSNALLTLTPPSPLTPFTGQTNVSGARPRGSVQVHGPGSYSVTGGGADIWDSADQFFFSSAEVTGDFDVRARVETLDAVNTWTKAGVMVRETLALDSRMAFIRSTPAAVAVGVEGNPPGANDIRLGYRTGIPGLGSNGGQHEDGGGRPQYPNAWLRLARSGDSIISHNSTNGIDWINRVELNTRSWQGGALASNLFLGLAVVSTVQGSGVTAEFGDLRDTVLRAPEITRQPADITARLDQSVVFAFGENSFFDPTRTYQWYRDGIPIPRAWDRSYATPPTTLADEGALFTVQITSPLGSVTSIGALLHVTEAPALLSASSRFNPNGITLVFTKDLDPAFALDLSNFRVFGPEIATVGVSFNPFLATNGPRSVIQLETTTLSTGTRYSVEVRDLRDDSMHGLNPNPAGGSFVHFGGVFCENFDSGIERENTRLTGSAYLAEPNEFADSGFLSLTDAKASQQGAYVIDINEVAGNLSVSQFKASFKLRIGDPGGLSPADGFSFNFGPELVLRSPEVEEGAETGLSVTFDNWDSGPLDLTDSAPAVEIVLDGEILATVSTAGRRQAGRAPVTAIPRDVNGDPVSLLTGNDFAEVKVNLDPDGTIDVMFNGVTLFEDVPTRFLPSPGIFSLAARTGGAYETHWVDDLCITLFESPGPVVVTRHPEDQTVVESRVATFVARVAGSPPYSVQWFSNEVAIPSANALTYRTPPTVPADRFNGTVYRVAVNNEFSSVESDSAMLTVIPDTFAPELIGATGDESFTRVTLFFSEAVDPVAAGQIANYSITNLLGAPLSVVGATLTNGTNVVLSTERQPEGTRYVVVTRNIADTSSAANPIEANNTTGFSTWVLSPVAVKREFYWDIPGFPLINLKTDPRYPDSPDYVDFAGELEFPLNFGIHFGVRMSGYLLPPVTGSYHFYLASNDNGELWLSTDDDPENLRLLALEPSWSQARDWTSTSSRNSVAPENRSTTLFPAGLFLEEGQRYYFEALMKEGVGSAYFGATWQKPGEPVPVNAPPIPGAYIGQFANPDRAGTITINQEPPSRTILQNESATFTIQAINSLNGPQSYQWLSNGVPVVDAIRPAYTTPPAQPEETGDRYSCRISILGKTVESAGAVLSVIPDLEPPRLLSAASLGSDTIDLCFSERLDPDAARQPANYIINGGAMVVLAATLRPDGQSVRLQLGPGSSAKFTVEAIDLVDLAGNRSTRSGLVGGSHLLTGVNVGNIQPSGSSFTCNNTDFIVEAGGPDIWGNSDEFQFVYTWKTNDFDIKVQVSSLEYVGDDFTTGGLMARENLNPASRNVTFYVTPPPPGDNAYWAQSRQQRGGSTDAFWGFSGGVVSFPNAWLRMKRVGHSWTGYWGVNGYDWTPYVSGEMVTADRLLVGMALTSNSGNPNLTTTATFHRFGEVTYTNVHVFVTGDPVDASVPVGVPATFTVVGQVVGAPQGEINYRWQRNGVDIPAANGSSYTTPPLTLDESGDRYRAVLHVPGAARFASQAATVTVTPAETIPPELVMAFQDPLDRNRIRLVFDEDLLRSSDPLQFALNQGSVLSALYLNPRVIELTAVGLTNSVYDGAYVVTVQGVRDASGNLIGMSNQATLFMGPLPVLFVVNQLGTLNRSDQLVKKRLETAGLSVQVADQEDSSTSDSRGLVLVSATAVPNVVSTRFRDDLTPFMTWQERLYDDMGFAATTSLGKGNQDILKIARAGHPLGAGLPAGTFAIAPQLTQVSLVSQQLIQGFGYCDPAGSPIVAATDLLNRAAVFGYEAGAPMAGSFTAPARRVGFFWDVDSAARANDTEWALFEAAVKWAMVPIFLQHPQSQTNAPGTDIILRAVAASRTPPIYQWRLNGQNIPGATNSTYTITNAQPKDGGSYSVVVANEAGAVLSEVATVILTSPTLEFANLVAERVGTNSLSGLGSGSSVGADKEQGEPNHAGKPGGASVWYAWTAPTDGVATFSTRGSTFDTLLAIYTGNNIGDLTRVADDEDRGGFFASLAEFNAVQGQEYLIAIDGLAGVQGHVVLCWELDPGRVLIPTITQQPRSRTVGFGETVQFSVMAEGTPEPLTYQWLFNGQLIAGATGPTLVVSDVDVADVGDYSVVVRNAAGGETRTESAALEISSEAELTSRDKRVDLFLVPGGGGPEEGQGGGLVPVGFVSVALGGGGFHIFDNIASTTEQNEGLIAGTIGGHSQWIGRFQVQETATLMVDTFGSDFDTTMAVWQVENEVITRLVREDDNSGPDGLTSLVRFQPMSDEEFIVAVDGARGQEGIVQLNWRLGHPPSVVGQPQPLSVQEGKDAELQVGGAGVPEVSYQWFFNDTNMLVGATNQMLLLDKLRFSDQGWYGAVISNAFGTVSSSNVFVAVELVFNVGLVMVQGADGKVLEVRLESGASQPTVLEASPDLESWVPIHTNLLYNTPYQFIDRQVGEFPVQFYRLVPY